MSRNSLLFMKNLKVLLLTMPEIPWSMLPEKRCSLQERLSWSHSHPWLRGEGADSSLIANRIKIFLFSLPSRDLMPSSCCAMLVPASIPILHPTVEDHLPLPKHLHLTQKFFWDKRILQCQNTLKFLWSFRLDTALPVAFPQTLSYAGHSDKLMRN